MGMWRIRGWLPPLLVLVLVAGCSGSGNNASEQDDDGTPTTATRSSGTAVPPNPTETGSNGSSTTSGSTGTTDGNGSDEGIAWVPFGPDDPTYPDPGIWPLYGAFAKGNCSEVQARGDSIGGYGKAMAAVCKAAVDGDGAQWAVAEDLVSGGLGSLQHPCLEAAVTDLLNRAIAWHKEHPGQTPTVYLRSVEGTTECGRTTPPETTEPSTEEPTSETPSTTADETPTSEETQPPAETPESPESPE